MRYLQFRQLFDLLICCSSLMCSKASEKLVEGWCNYCGSVEGFVEWFDGVDSRLRKSAFRMLFLGLGFWGVVFMFEYLRIWWYMWSWYGGSEGGGGVGGVDVMVSYFPHYLMLSNLLGFIGFAVWWGNYKSFIYFRERRIVEDPLVQFCRFINDRFDVPYDLLVFLFCFFMAFGVSGGLYLRYVAL